jgi:MoaF C-terminal domain/MoaF N-terminal domain
MAESSEWITVGALGEAFEQEPHLLPRVERLAGRAFDLHFENGSQYRLQFRSSTQLSWIPASSAPRPERRESRMTAAYVATEIRPGVLLINFVRSDEPAGSITLVLDTSLHICTAILGRLPSKEEAREPLIERAARGMELTCVDATLLAGAVEAPFTASTARHAVTGELVGKRVEYTYSPTERYEHIYLNENFYAWHCLSGSEKGLADTDRCHYRKIADDLYLFVWREKVVPTLGIVVVDLAQLKTTGQLLGYRSFDFGAVTNFPVGARARVLNVT